MQLKSVTGVIVNYRVDPHVIDGILPAPFRPALVNGYAIASICVIQLRVRPSWLPEQVGFRSINAAHRVAVTMPDGRSAVYVPRRDSNSLINTLVGGRLFPGNLHRARISSVGNDEQFSIALTSRDQVTRVSVSASIADQLPDGSVFGNIQHMSDFLEDASVAYSDSASGDCFEGVELETTNWSVTPLEIHHANSSFFDDQALFPNGSAGSTTH